MIPKHYTSGLSKKDKSRQLREIKKSKRLYKKGKYHTRKKMKSFKKKRSRHVVDFEKKYKVKITNKAGVAKKTKISPKAQRKILRKGRGAYYSSGSRPGQTPSSWAYARLASVAMKRGAYKVDKHILNEHGIKLG